MTEDDFSSVQPTRREQAQVFGKLASFSPVLTAGVLVASFLTALLEGAGIGLLLPVVDVAQSDGAITSSSNDVIQMLISVYATLGLSFTLRNLLIGIGSIMTIRYVLSLVVDYVRARLQHSYTRYLQRKAFQHTINARVAYFDERGSDDILNAIVTQAVKGGRLFTQTINLIDQLLISMVYISITLYLAPVLTIVSGIVMGVITIVLRTGLESGYEVGDRVADANEGVQKAAQAGTQGVRDIKLFNLEAELLDQFDEMIDTYVDAQIKLTRNKAIINNGYRWFTALIMIALIYFALEITTLSLAGLGVFIFAMYRLAPKVSTLNNRVYNIEGNLPHLIRTYEFIAKLEENAEPAGDTAEVPPTIEEIQFENVSFSYKTGELVLDDVSFSVNGTEFAAFVGPSGAGKSTIVGLLARLYEPDSGRILVNGTPIQEFDLQAWRSKLSVVRQHPFIFNDTLYYNLTIGNRDASRERVEEVCEIAQVTEFLDELPQGYDTILGDDGVKLSGGQRQRVAIARALLCDSEFLILDEATSDLDTNLEEKVHRAVEAMERDYAMLVIAHRLSTVMNADRIYTMEDGAITESGTHQELVEIDGRYSDLYETQIQS
jgi:subfamily B ATP-binding cassette protein MsbA